jgi:hypothetical protein
MLPPPEVYPLATFGTALSYRYHRKSTTPYLMLGAVAGGNYCSYKLELKRFKLALAPKPPPSPADRQRTRKHYSAEQTIRTVLDGLQRESPKEPICLSISFELSLTNSSHQPPCTHSGSEAPVTSHQCKQAAHSIGRDQQPPPSSPPTVADTLR